MRNAFRIAGFVAAALLIAFVTVARGEQNTPKQVVLDDLQKALDNEFNARMRYRAFAEKAIEEGYQEIASLFHAAARAEEVHAGLFMSLSLARGGSGQAVTESVDVKTTRENLARLVAAEKLERDQVYPLFAEHATAAGDKRAADVFEMVRSAEVEHFNLCSEAAADLEKHKGPARTWYVCRGCGYTTPLLPAGKCPICRGSHDDFREVE
ncbi:MAG: rubrerythrin [Thermoanaerobaculia bacterium]|nr:rubrerythrin [Thermoanaerobaculia bacterium]